MTWLSVVAMYVFIIMKEIYVHFGSHKIQSNCIKMKVNYRGSLLEWILHYIFSFMGAYLYEFL